LSTYWHAFTGTSDDGMFACVTVGPTDRAADDLTDAGKLVRDYTIPTMLGIEATYTTSFDHEPSEAETDALNRDPALVDR
jgi:hypothetical protein